MPTDMLSVYLERVRIEDLSCVETRARGPVTIDAPPGHSVLHALSGVPWHLQTQRGSSLVLSPGDVILDIRGEQLLRAHGSDAYPALPGRCRGADFVLQRHVAGPHAEAIAFSATFKLAAESIAYLIEALPEITLVSSTNESFQLAIAPLMRRLRAECRSARVGSQAIATRFLEAIVLQLMRAEIGTLPPTGDSDEDRPVRS